MKLEKEQKGISPVLWEGLRNSLCRMTMVMHGHMISVRTMPKNIDELGMTDTQKNIFLNPYHPLVQELPEREAVMFVKGVFAHEDMHIHLTNFSVFQKAENQKPVKERHVFHTICNIIEDPTIEYFASQFLGKKLLQALRFSIMYLYQQSPPLETAATPTEQFFHALIQYGDGGLLKGDFTFPEARRTFREVLPYVDKAIEEFNPAVRVQHMDKVFELSRPLWETELDAVEELAELLRELGRDHSRSSGTGDPSFGGECTGKSNSKTNRRRKITFRRVTQEEADELTKNNTSDGSAPPDGDIEVLLVDGKTQTAKEKPSNETPAAAGQTDAHQKDSSDIAAATPSLAPADNGEKDDEADPAAEKADDKLQDADETLDVSGGNMDDNEADDDIKTISEDEYVLSEDEVKEITEEIAKVLQEARETAEKEKQAAQEQIDLPEIEKKYPNVHCTNIKVPFPPGENQMKRYAQIVAEQSSSISSLTNQLKRIFRNDAEEREYRTSGKVCVKRLTNGTVSPRVFERKRLPGNKDDIAILMLIDESGSMRGGKTETAQKAAILLAEVFGSLHIPLKVVGFTESDSVVRHYHYLSWINTVSERTKLLTISARCANFDG